MPGCGSSVLLPTIFTKQMRTIAMDFWASLEHKLRYKKNLNPQTIEELAKELEACAEESAKLDEKMLRIRERIAADMQ